MGDYDLYRSRISAYGNTIKEGNTNATLNFINNTFEDSPSYFEVSINGSEQLLGVRITDNSTNAANKVDYIRKIIMKPDDSISTGDIVDWDNKKWLVISAEKFSDLYWYGMIQECNNTLKFYKKQNQTSILFEVPCIFSDGSVSLEEGRFLSLPSGHYEITIPSGNITKSDMNMRYILNDAPYKTFGINNAINGLIKIEVVDDSEGFILDDNRELGIANYYSNQSSSDDPLEGYSITISPTDSTINSGSSKTFTATVLNDGIEDNTKRTIWIITNKDSSYTPYCLMTYDNRTCTITASDLSVYVGKIINLRVLLEDNDLIDTNKEITITSFI